MANSKPKTGRRGFWADGEPFVWATAGALALTLLSIATLIIVVMVNGLGVMWPSNLALLQLADGPPVLGQIEKTNEAGAETESRLQLKVGNRDFYGLDFRWINDAQVVEVAYPEDALVLERREYGDFYGFLQSLEPGSMPVPQDVSLWEQFQAAREAVEVREHELDTLRDEIRSLNYATQRVQLRLQKLTYQGAGEDHPEVIALKSRHAELRTDFEKVVSELDEHVAVLEQTKAVVADAAGRTKEIALREIVRSYRPNDMSPVDKGLYYLSRLRELLLEEPRESNTEGGLFPAIFGTVMLVFLMSVLSFPLGVLAGVYLREYAKEGPLVRAVYIAVNNLAGIPSIVYGIFGLGFFVYGIGGAIDQFFFPERLPTPTFGTGGVLWASLTLGFLTVPVVIVATDEALGSVPKGIREGSYALGATRLQTLLRAVLPMASPGIMTGFILAMARAAGEVAPLMITGVVKLAPALPLDAQFPYVHLERKFMHLGFHIYDIGFQSPNVEAAKPMVFVTTLLLVLIVLVMSSVAIYLRNQMRKRYTVRSL
jgi:phosphate transport system permease protein